MPQTTALAVNGTVDALPAQWESKMDLIRRSIAKDASPDELELLLYTAKSRGLDPLLRQIHGVSRWDSKLKRKTMTIQVGIDGYRLIAARTGDYAGSDEAVFIEGDPYPVKASVTVWRFARGQRVGFTASAYWSEYYPGDDHGFMWKKMPHVMLGKVAEAQALRKAFPAELSGLLTHEEMDQAGREADTVPSNPLNADTVNGEIVEESAPLELMVTSVKAPLYQQFVRGYHRALELEVPQAEELFGSIKPPIAEADLKAQILVLAGLVQKHTPAPTAPTAEPAQ